MLKNIINTPLLVVYADEYPRISFAPYLDLRRISKVWGVGLKTKTGYLFLSKNNGPDVTYAEAVALIKRVHSALVITDCGNDDEIKRLATEPLFTALPHQAEIEAWLTPAAVKSINQTMEIFRSHGISADNVFEKGYLAYSKDKFVVPSLAHSRNVSDVVRKKVSPFALVSKADTEELVWPQDETAKVYYHTRISMRQYDYSKIRIC